MSKQTAVEWLVEQLAPSVSLQQKYIDELLEQAKAMEKEQIIDAYSNNGWNDEDQRANAELYYNEQFKQDNL
jgi:hypothetical protein